MPILFIQMGDMGIVFPKFRKRSPNISDELAGIIQMEIPNRRRKHHDVSNRKVAFQNDLFQSSRGILCERLTKSTCI
jgi:hypothetical protein